MTDRSYDIVLPPILFPGQERREQVFRTAHDLLTRHHPKQALELLEAALSDDPGNTGLRSLRAWAYLQRAQLQRAETELRSLVEDDPSDAWARHALGRALERQSKLTDALPQLRLAAAMTGDSEHVDAVARVAHLLSAR